MSTGELSTGELFVSATVADRGLQAQFTVGSGEVLALVGPNGAGKSTVAAVIAGLLAADRALVRVGGHTLTDTDRGVQVAPHRRRVGLLLGDPLLFPHLSVLGNVAFAARRRAGRRDARDAAARWLAEVGVADLASRRPDQLSGGQAQRVALARALATEPEVMVLDEPLAGLDVAAAASTRAVLREVTAAAGSRATLLITHDLLDVLALADRVLVLEAGRVAEAGPTTAVLTAPRSRFGARFAGVNLVRGVVAEPAAVRSATALWRGVPSEPLTPGQQAVAVFAPAAVAVYRVRPDGSPRNSVRVRISGLEVIGPAVRVHTDPAADGAPGPAADITPEAVAHLTLAVGDEVWFSVKAQEVALHAAARTSAVSTRREP